MRIEPKILDGDFEKKSLYEKSKTQQDTAEVEPYDALFINPERILAGESLSQLEVISDEDRQEIFSSRDIGKAFVPEMDTKEVESASIQESFEEANKKLLETFGISPEEMSKLTNSLEDALRNAF